MQPTFSAHEQLPLSPPTRLDDEEDHHIGRFDVDGAEDSEEPSTMYSPERDSRGFMLQQQPPEYNNNHFEQTFSIQPVNNYLQGEEEHNEELELDHI